MMQKMYIIQTSVALLVSSSSLHWESLAISLKSSLIGSDKLFLCVLISTIIIYLNSSQVEGGKILKECQYNCSQIPSLLSQFKTIQASYLFFNTFFFLDYYHMKGLDKQQNQEKWKSHQGGTVARYTECTVIFGGIKIDMTSFQL